MIHTRPAHLLFLLLLPCGQRASAIDLRAWAFEATIVQVDDPEDVFGDVQLGDTVRGTFRYDLDTPGEPVHEEWTDYFHAPTFPGMSVVIENPRTGGELRFDAAAEPYYLVSVFSGASYFDGISSALAFSYLAEPPLPDVSNLMYMDFVGPHVLSDVELPTELNLDDWQAATVWFLADYAVVARLHSLTSINVEGDYNGNGWVEQADLDLVLLNWGSDVLPDTWLNDLPTGAIDQDELDKVLLGWGNTLPVGAATAPVPEPTTSALAFLSITGFVVSFGRRRRFSRRMPMASGAMLILLTAAQIDFGSFFPGSLRADPAIMLSDPGFSLFDSADGLDGFAFTVGSHDIQVSSLAWFDESQDGLADDHPVGIWQQHDQSLVVLAVIPAGTVGRLDGHFREVDVEPTVLDAHTSYRIAGYSPTGADLVFYDPPGWAVNPVLSFDVPVGAFAAGGLDYPADTFPGFIGFFGPNFDAVAIGEPMPRQPVLNPENGHFYDFVAASDITWNDAQAAAEELTFMDEDGTTLEGYLATITSREEEAFLQSYFGHRELVWIGASDAAVEGEWRWVTGPETIADGGQGELFWIGKADGSASGFHNWQTTDSGNLIEPNALTEDEDYIDWNHNGSGQWNDVESDTPRDFISGYFVEFGGIVVDVLAGDYNDNGTVEQGDLDLVLLNWGSDVAPPTWQSDLPTGAINQEELDKVLLGWGSVVPVAAAAVPEPTSRAILLVCAALVTIPATARLAREGRCLETRP